MKLSCEHPDLKCNLSMDPKVSLPLQQATSLGMSCMAQFYVLQVLSQLQDDEIFPPMYEDKLPVEVQLILHVYDYNTASMEWANSGS